MPLGLNTNVGKCIGERDLDLPSADEQGDDVGGIEGDVRAEEGLGGAFAIGILDQYPSDRHYRGAGPVPQCGIGGDPSDLLSTWP